MLIDRVSDIARQACIDLFADYGVSLEPAGDPRALGDVLYCGVIGFTGDGIRGSIVLAGSSAALDQSNPIPGSRVRDWIGELTNQLVGRIKNRLLKHGVEVWITTPIVLRGRQIALETANDSPLPMYFAGGRGGVAVWFDVDSDPEFELHEEEASATLDEGMSLLF